MTMARLKEVFWFKTVVRAEERALSHARRSRQALRSLDFLEDPAPLERFITGVEQVSGTALRKQRESVEFLRAYRQRTDIRPESDADAITL
jgi:hypothetical protein